MENSLSKMDISSLFKHFIDPYHGQDWERSHVLQSVHAENETLKLDLQLGYPIQDILSVLHAQVLAFLEAHTSFKKFELNFKQKIISHRVQQGLKGMEAVKNILAIASGKGGVGKSTVAANLALALSLGGARVGLLDADIYGPSQPQLMGAYEKPKIENKKMFPLMRHGVATMSMGYLVDEHTPLIWRGPMISAALQQLLNDTLWPALDYLIIDLPPGTGDIQLTLCQKIPLSAALIVTTPQDLSLIDARRAIEMFRKVKVPVLGVIENMSLYHCPQCGHEAAIFGTGAGQFLKEEEGIELLGRLPLAPEICADADQGTPTVIKAPDSDLSQKYRDIARRAASTLSLEAKNFALKIPAIVVEHKD